MSENTNGPPKVRNEEYFASLGQTNASRTSDLPPSQGGKYAGFGNPAFASQQQSQLQEDTSFSTDELLNDPMTALTKGWTFFSKRASVALTSVAAGAKIVGENLNERVIQPTRNTLTDPEFSERVGGMVSAVGKTVVSTGAAVGKTVVTTGTRGVAMVSEMMAQPGTSNGGYSDRHSYTDIDGSDSTPLQRQQQANEDDFFAKQESVARDKTRTASAIVSSRGATGRSGSGSRKSVQSRKKASGDWDNDKWEEF